MGGFLHECVAGEREGRKKRRKNIGKEEKRWRREEGKGDKRIWMMTKKINNLKNGRSRGKSNEGGSRRL